MAALQPVLEISVQGGVPIRLPLRERRVTLGRSPFNDLTFDDPSISRLHCEFTAVDEGYRLTDRSGKGLKINGETVSGKLLSSGDRISLGGMLLVYKLMPLVSPEMTSGRKGGTAPLSDRETAPSGFLTWEANGKVQHMAVEQPVIIGADDGAAIRIEDEFVSSRHCQILPTEEGVILRDLASRNGTWIGDLRIQEVTLPRRVKFKAGRTEFQYQGREAAGQTEAPKVFFGMIGGHPSLTAVQSLIRRVAPLRETILIFGETGTGKELAARAIHELSGRGKQPFIAVNCGAIANELIESELFGHEKGAFTGAAQRRIGAFEAAGNGTVFLDEIGELPLALQPKLLRALDGHEIKPVGSDQVRYHKARVVAATNRDLRTLTAEGKFREDLFYRLNTLPVRLPPLRERRGDIPLLAGHFLESSGSSVRLTEGALDALTYHYWPGNIRELRNVLVASLCYHPEAVQNGFLDETQLLFANFLIRNALAENAESFPQPVAYHGRTLERAEAELIQEALAHYGGNKSLVSRALGISKSTLYEKIKRYRLDAPEKSEPVAR